MIQRHDRMNSPHRIVERHGEQLRKFIEQGDIGVSEIGRLLGLKYSGGSQARVLHKAAALMGLVIPNQRASAKANGRISQTLTKLYAEDDSYRARISEAVRISNTPEVRQKKSDAARKRFKEKPGPVGGEKHNRGRPPGPQRTKEEFLALHRLANARYRQKERERLGKPEPKPRVPKVQKPKAVPKQSANTVIRPLVPRAPIEDDSAQIARFIAERGVTKCPTVACAPTDAQTPCSDTGAVRKYHAKQQAGFEASIAARVARGARKRKLNARSKHLEGSFV